MYMKLSFLPFCLFISFLFTITLPAQDFSSLEYRTVGPERGGRVTAVTGIPNEPGTFYLGATGGGVWKTLDYGTSWFNISDGYFETPSIGAIEVSLKNPNVVYVGTGSDGLRSNVISGKGVYRSGDAGKTWQHIGLRDAGQIGAVEIDRKDDNIVWVAAIGDAFKPNAARGIFKTTDAGRSWEKVLFISEETGFSDLEIHPKKSDVIYAAAWKGQRKPWTIISGGTNAEGGIYKSKNGGKDWIKLEKGLPTGLIGKIDLAVTAADPDVLYAVIEAPGEEGGLYRSDDEGKSFVQVSSEKGLVNRPFYYTNIEVDPTNADVVYSNANPILKSVDGGKTWKEMHVPHGDNHDIWINPNNPQLIIQANDGGANVSHNGGKTWSTQFNQPTSEIYQVEVDDQYPYWLYGGMQDNYSTIAVPSYPPYGIQHAGTGWIINTGGCETGPAVPKPGDHNIVYANCKGRFSVFDKRTGTEKGYYVGAANIYGHNPKDLEYRFQRVAPIHVSPHDPNVVYHGSQYLHKTSDGGLTWETVSPDLTAFEADKQVVSGSPITRDITGEEYYSTLYSIRESELTEGLIWTGSNDGVVSVTRDGGINWKDVTPEGLPKGGRVESIAASKFDPAKAYIAIDRHLMGDTKPYLYKTTDYGESWQLLTSGTNGIPADFTTRVLREDPVKEGLLYAGTEFGVFISFNDGLSWVKFQQNLPVTPITDLKIFRDDLILSTMGRGFWILDDISLLRQAGVNTQGGIAQLFQPGNTIRYRSPSGSRTDFPKYPSTGVLIDYYLPKEYSEGIEIEILDANKKSVVTIVSDSTQLGSTETIVEDMNLNRSFRYADEKLETKEGLNRFRWNLRERGPWHEELERRYKNGPMVVPGTYTVRLRVGAQTFEQPFEVLPDPRVLAQGIDNVVLEQQHAFMNEVTDLLSTARKFQVDLEQEVSVLETQQTEVSKQRLQTINAVLTQLRNDEGAYPQQMLVSQISYLLNMVNGADQLPGEEATERLEELRSRLQQLQEEVGA
jgi:photosystem II stability/assembly factor-like uncharacterized protein/polyhydroxyalkanoate synthesis regulator phasin